MGRQSFMVSDFYCIKCGSKGMPLARKKGKQKEGGSCEFRKNWKKYFFTN